MFQYKFTIFKKHTMPGLNATDGRYNFNIYV